MVSAARGFVFTDARRRDFRDVVDCEKQREQNGEADADRQRNSRIFCRKYSRNKSDADIAGRKLSQRSDGIARHYADFGNSKPNSIAQDADIADADARGSDINSKTFDSKPRNADADALTAAANAAANASDNSPAAEVPASAAARMHSTTKLRYRLLRRRRLQLNFVIS
jgi:hypothetical protein